MLGTCYDHVRNLVLLFKWYLPVFHISFIMSLHVSSSPHFIVMVCANVTIMVIGCPSCSYRTNIGTVMSYKGSENHLKIQDKRGHIFVIYSKL